MTDSHHKASKNVLKYDILAIFNKDFNYCVYITDALPGVETYVTGTAVPQYPTDTPTLTLSNVTSQNAINTNLYLWPGTTGN